MMQQALTAVLQDVTQNDAVCFFVRGESMNPKVHDGDRVYIVKKRYYWPGDIIVFDYIDGNRIVHRVIGYRPTAGKILLVTQGDSQPKNDVPIELERVIGAVNNVPVSVVDRIRSVWKFASLIIRIRKHSGRY